MNFFARIKKILRAASPSQEPVFVGGVHDLRKMYEEINIEYFEGKLTLSIGWFGRKNASRRISRKVLGYYDERKKSVRIHRSLDHPSFPEFFIAYVIYHEMLHSVERPIQGRGRRKIHHAGFKDREKKFHSYAVAKEWEKGNLAKLLYGRREYGRS